MITWFWDFDTEFYVAGKNKVCLFTPGSEKQKQTCLLRNLRIDQENLEIWWGKWTLNVS